MSSAGGVPVLDARCRAIECRDAGEYMMQAACGNCGRLTLVRLTRGHESTSIQTTCPACGITRWRFSPVPQEQERPTSDAATAALAEVEALRAKLARVEALALFAAELQAEEAQPAPSKTIDIVFDGPPGQQAPRFVEVENAAGASVSVGEWVHRDDGYWVLRIGAFLALEGVRDGRLRVSDIVESVARERGHPLPADVCDKIERAVLECGGQAG